MDRPLHSNLRTAEWTDEKLAQAHAIRDLVGDENTEPHPGWAALLRVLDAHANTRLRNLMRGKGVQEGAVYAKELGYVDALRSLNEIAQGIVEKGQKVELARKTEEVTGGS